MHELNCPTCNTPSQYNFDDFLLLCPFCSSTFRFYKESGEKEPYSDHYIIPTGADPAIIKGMVIEWLKRLHHRPGTVPKEYFVVDIVGVSIPYWVISLEAHTQWKGLTKKDLSKKAHLTAQNSYLPENGYFRRPYRWAVSARKNIFEYWGINKLHIPNEKVFVDWDGFPLDSTFSRGRLTENEGKERSAYDVKEFFEFKFANNLPILEIQVSDSEAIRRAKHHVNQYHFRMSKLNVDTIIDFQTELEIAGVQLIHLPFWLASYVYKPRNFLRYLQPPKEKKVLFEGYTVGVLNGELAVIQKDKLWVNTGITAGVGLIFLFIGGLLHPAFFFVAFFAFVIAAMSAYKALARAQEEAKRNIDEDQLPQLEKNNKEPLLNAG